MQFEQRFICLSHTTAERVVWRARVWFWFFFVISMIVNSFSNRLQPFLFLYSFACVHKWLFFFWLKFYLIILFLIFIDGCYLVMLEMRLSSVRTRFMTMSYGISIANCVLYFIYLLLKDGFEFLILICCCCFVFIPWEKWLLLLLLLRAATASSVMKKLHTQILKYTRKVDIDLKWTRRDNRALLLFAIDSISLSMISLAWTVFHWFSLSLRRIISRYEK